MGELVAALRAKGPDVFKSGGVQDLGESVVEELLQDWLALFLTAEEQERLTGWHMVVDLKTQSLQCFWPLVTSITGSFDAGHQLDR